MTVCLQRVGNAKIGESADPSPRPDGVMRASAVMKPQPPAAIPPPGPSDTPAVIEVLRKEIEIERKLMAATQKFISQGHPDDGIMQKNIAQAQQCARNIARYTAELEDFTGGRKPQTNSYLELWSKSKIAAKLIVKK